MTDGLTEAVARASFAMLRFFDGTEVQLQFASGKSVDDALAALRLAATGTAHPTAEPTEAIALDSGLRCNLDGAIGGTYQLDDGREFWMDAAATREIVNRIEPVIVSWLNAHRPTAELGDLEGLVRDLFEPHFIKDTDFMRTPDAVLNSHSLMRSEREKAATTIRALLAETRCLA